MDFDPITRTLWDTEPGHWISDETNIVRPGFKSGYGIIQGLGIYFPAASFCTCEHQWKWQIQRTRIRMGQKGSTTRSEVSTIRQVGI